jgi:hypothetical protein
MLPATVLAWMWVGAVAPPQLLPAREQMAFTLGFHIILVPFGVALTFIMMVANYRAIRHDDEVALRLAQRLRALAVAAVGAVIVGWGVAQYPEMLGTHLTTAAAASPRPTLVATVVVSVAAAILCVPSLALLYVLQQRGRLEEA